MARKSNSDRVNEILRANPALRRDDPRIGELIAAEAMLRKAQREANKSPVLAETAAGNAKRHPAWVAVDNSNTAVRRLRNELAVDRLSQKRSEAAGVKVKRSQDADKLIALHGESYSEDADLIPGLCLGLAAHGVLPEDLAERHRERFEADMERYGDQLDAVRDRMRG